MKRIVLDKNIAPYLVNQDEPLSTAMEKIDRNDEGFVLCVDEAGTLNGILTDGDFRRWSLQANVVNLKAPTRVALNNKVVFASQSEDYEAVAKKLTAEIAFIPLVDHRRRVVSIARVRDPHIMLGDRLIGAAYPVFVIAEIGNNHNGCIARAKELVDVAIAAGADCAKFQLRDISSLYRNQGCSDDAGEDLGSQYTLSLLNRFQLSDGDMERVFDHCREKGILPLCTPWDEVSLEKLEKWDLRAYKTASADFNNHVLLGAVASTGKPTICSTGMTTRDEAERAIEFLDGTGTEFMLMHCNSTYPAPYKDLNLRFLNWLEQKGKCPVGYSSHELGWHGVAAAVALGAKVIEKHFTLDKDLEGNDHRISLLPSEFRQMVQAIHDVEEALGDGHSRVLSQGEMLNRETLSKSIVMATGIEKGEIFRESQFLFQSPGTGLSPNRKEELIGRPSNRLLKKGDILYESDLTGIVVKPRNYRFSRPFGIPVRYHDVSDLYRSSNFDLLEFHLSAQDLAVDASAYLKTSRDCDLVVHAPELFVGDHLLNLCSENDRYQEASIANLKKVVEVAKTLRQFFCCPNPTKVVVNVGGHTSDRPTDFENKKKMYRRIEESLGQLKDNQIEFLPQTMPPFPWHFGGRRFHNLFVEKEEIAEFCGETGFRVCLDLSHSKLACNFLRTSFQNFLTDIAPFAGHLHIADATGLDGEGLQVEEGEIDWWAVLRVLDEVAPRVSFIPEIWQGHKDNGSGFWVGLDRLERMFQT